MMFDVQTSVCSGSVWRRRRREDEKTRGRNETSWHKNRFCLLLQWLQRNRAFLFWVSTHYLMNGDEVTSVYSSERFDVLTEESRGQNFNSSFAFKPQSLFPVWTPSCTFISFFKWNKRRQLLRKAAINSVISASNHQLMCRLSWLMA